MKILRRLFLFWLPILVWMGLIYAVSADSNPYRAFPNAHASKAVKPTATAAHESAAPAPESSAPQATADSRPKSAAKTGVPDTALRPEYEALGRLAHFLEYGVMSFLLARAFAQSGLESRRRGRSVLILAVAFLLAFGFGLGDEFHQSGVAGRTFQDVDLILDGLGAAAGTLGWVRLRH
jgi:VanZ family protein